MLNFISVLENISDIILAFVMLGGYILTAVCCYKAAVMEQEDEENED